MAGPEVAEQRRGALAAGRERLGEVYGAYQPWLVRFIGQRVDPRERAWAEDFAQNTFVSAWPRLAGADFSEAGSPRPWLATIARRVLSDRYRGGSGLQRAAETPVAPESPLWQMLSAAPAAEAGDEVADRRESALRAALDALPAETRRVLELRYLQGMSRREAAREMGRGTATVDRRTAAGLATLRGDTALEAAVTGRPDPMARARRAVAEVQQRQAAVEHQQAVQAARARQLARWHTDDHIDALRDQGRAAERGDAA